MIRLSKEELQLAYKINQVKEAAGGHSPSTFTLNSKLPELNIKIDACFLSNPYATDLFLKYLDNDLIKTGKLRDLLEFYPSQNSVIAEFVSKIIHVNKENIFIGNGATEIIQAILHRFVKRKIIISIPTFSSYYEFAKKDTEIVYYRLKKENGFLYDVDDYINFVKKHKPDTIVIINPNNPNGGYIKYKELRYIVNSLKEVDNIIIDESFIHFAFEDDNYSLLSATELYKEFSNIIVVKSMSKDFGVAGIRAGYAVMDRYRVSDLLETDIYGIPTDWPNTFFNCTEGKILRKNTKR